MPVNLEWHATLPILILTYNGTLSSADYAALCKKRREMLDKAAQHVIVLADVQGMTGVTSLSQATEYTPALEHPRVRAVLIVLPDNLFRSLRRAIDDTAAYDYRVQFFRTTEAALDYAKRLLGR